MRQNRAARVGDEIQKVISQLLLTEVKDPRIPMMTSVMEVRMSSDLTHATVFLSVYGSQQEKRECMEAVNRASGFIRSQIAKRIKLRVAPELHFKLDESIEKGMDLMNLIDRTIKEDQERAGNHE
ncbi:MAG TPA: 30S ribosome-binding factor RbfA [Clostridiales bacterium]|jgi:ribosome-binding factor A|nr:30S ribosome-binding factor RbfA [Clostridiales bacterium]MBQ4184999.1 30S ribosome-binding factor RbfA [Clostridiales bacterium]MEE3351009.1 30S ribosome-binding factor RbfA [Saccharofermentanaceae bacterium]HBY32615.1 30S ribosome-binding factor RbfA [Clostridiales bacterium]HBZ77286.1 30S ribosome-binding factor RbfA [Clostridiales bacterium]